MVILTGQIACSGKAFYSNAHLYRVKHNDTLYAIAWRYNLDYKMLAQWNDIKAPYTIHKGQMLALAPRKPVARIETPQSSPRTVIKATKSPATTKRTANVKRDIQSAPKNWVWPTRGTLVSKFGSVKSASMGIDIAGTVGQPITAASTGKVVYSGSGLSSYGKLLIIKHNEDYLSAYAYNSKLLVQEGDRVKVGQKIAEMGTVANGVPRLHFEIRRLGKPVDPLKYLPQS